MGDTGIAPARGTLLVARPHLLDPNFVQSVILLCEHDDAGGSLGFVLNRPSDRSLDQVLQGDHDFAGRTDRVYVGGPVSLDSLAVLHRTAGVPGALEILPGLQVGGSAAELGRRFRDEGTPPSDARFLVGYSGWGEGQLAAELAEESWVVCPARPEWVFDADPETLWRRVLRSMGGAWSVLPNLPFDPSLN